MDPNGLTLENAQYIHHIDKDKINMINQKINVFDSLDQVQPSGNGLNFQVKLKDCAKVPKSRFYPVPLSMGHIKYKVFFTFGMPSVVINDNDPLLTDWNLTGVTLQSMVI
ncbi:hypothetical protein ACTFIW_008774 [Dictyostelium discoideum]